MPSLDVTTSLAILTAIFSLLYAAWQAHRKATRNAVADLHEDMRDIRERLAACERHREDCERDRAVQQERIVGLLIELERLRG